jgi:hypothetical protein
MMLGSYQRKGVQRIAVKEVVRNGLQKKSFSDKKEDKTRIEAKDRDWQIERAKHTDVAHTGRGWCFAYRARRTKKFENHRRGGVGTNGYSCRPYTPKRKTGKDQRPNLLKGQG